MKRILFLAAAILSPLSASALPVNVTATVYHSSLHGGPDYCTGRPYQHWGISAASSWIPCGARVRVTHQGRSLLVPIRDKCPSCDLDLSAGAAHRLGVPLDGVARVRVSR